MAFKAYEDIVGPIVLTYHGREYELPALTVEQGLDVHARLDSQDIPPTYLADTFLGDAGTRMHADKVPLAVIDRALWVAVTDWKLGREAAEQVWETGVPKAVLAQMRAAAEAALTTPAAAASTTPPPASGSSTTNPKKTRARRSPGQSS